MRREQWDIFKRAAKLEKLDRILRVDRPGWAGKETLATAALLVYDVAGGRLLGTSAGGGLPQWNCGCPNCVAVRREVPG